MTYAERLVSWNQWYDKAPAEWRFQFVLWGLLVLGAVNLFLTVWARFPFALLVVLGIVFIAAVRVPYVLGWLKPAAEMPNAEAAVIRIEGANWIVDLNRRYDAMPETRRFWVFPAILLAAGAINMLLTIGGRFPFGLLFLVVLLALVAIRAPYAAGWVKPATAIGNDSGYGDAGQGKVEHLSAHAIPSGMSSAPTPPVAAHTPDTPHGTGQADETYEAPPPKD